MNETAQMEQVSKRNHVRLLSFAAVTAAAGCSGDGDFFLGALNHNEGAVDYRVAPLSVDPEMAENGRHPLGSDGCMPYIKLETANDVGSFSRTKTPEPLRRAEEEVRQIQQQLSEFRIVERIEEKTLSDLNALLDSARKDADAAQQDLDSKKQVLAAIVNKEHAGDNTVDKVARESLISAANKEIEAATATLEAKTRSRDERQNLVRAQESRRNQATTNRENAESALSAASQALASAQGTFDEELKNGNATRELVQTVRVTLKQAYLREFAELGKVGEIVILMTVKEGRSGLGHAEPKAGRVVYYSEGARKDAFMNFRDQPVYGPIRYNGDDLHIRLSILELDEKDNAVASGMLKTLATIGSISYPPSSPVLSALDQIGESLLTLNGPDLEWDYLMRLSARPPSTSGGTAHVAKQCDAWLRDGYFVLLRSDTTTDQVRRARVSHAVWQSLYIDPQSAVLFVKDGKQFREYTDRSYLVFAVQTGFDSTQLDLAQEAAELSTIISAYGGSSEALVQTAESMARSLQQSLGKADELRAQRRRSGGK